MARWNRNQQPGWLDVFSLLPWWLCLALAVISHVLLAAIAANHVPPASFAARPGSFTVGSYFWTLALLGQYVIPFAFSIVAVAQIGRRLAARYLFRRPVLDPDSTMRPVDPIDPWRKPFAEWEGAIRDELAEPEIDTSQWNLPLLKALDWKRFELLCAGYFEELGFRAETTRAGPDGGVDIHLFTNESRHPAIVVQCKAWRNVPVGVSLVRELLGVMTAADVKEGIIATVGTFTGEARTFALGKNIHLIDGEDFLVKLAALPPDRQRSLLAFATEGDFTTPTCPSCGIGTRMMLRTSGKDGARFWGCGNFPRCRATIAISGQRMDRR
jgi:restriction system protein